jgi:hypothetical protein
MPSMTYSQALKQCKRTGTANATGDGLRAMYARLLPVHHGLHESRAEIVFEHLGSFCADADISAEGQRLLRSRKALYAIIWPTTKERKDA